MPGPDLTTACPVRDLTTACPVPDLTTACPVRASARGPRRGGPVPAGGPASAGPCRHRADGGRVVPVPWQSDGCAAPCAARPGVGAGVRRRPGPSAASGNADGPRLLPGAVLSVGWVVPEAVTGYGAPSHRTPAPCVTTP
ncbi:hypothetical protein GCM10010451_63070 [Streptomyces virens]|uniref:Uncharacterized protein n=1 Tax=Streptomyces virens TaxID=285572 RepID=A0ABP6Q4V4_9ACTN